MLEDRPVIFIGVGIRNNDMYSIWGMSADGIFIGELNFVAAVIASACAPPFVFDTWQRALLICYTERDMH